MWEQRSKIWEQRWEQPLRADNLVGSTTGSAWSHQTNGRLVGAHFSRPSVTNL